VAAICTAAPSVACCAVSGMRVTSSPAALVRVTASPSASRLQAPPVTVVTMERPASAMTAE